MLLLQPKYSPNTKSCIKTEYDFIIVGAGAAGSVLANRLSEKKCKTVLLLEAGKPSPAMSEIPGILGVLRITDANWHYWTEPQKHTAGERMLTIPSLIQTFCGMADLQVFIRSGQTCNAAKAYLVPVDHRCNLDIVTEAFVTKIQINNKIAQGVWVEYEGSSHYVSAKEEVILSAGAFNSPKILMHSGIGPRETLEKFKIPVHADLPVGHNLQDHISSVIFFHIPSGIPYLQSSISPKIVEEFHTNLTGQLSSPTAIFNMGYHRSEDAATPTGVPNFESCFIEGDNTAIKMAAGLSPLACEKNFLPYENTATMWCVASVSHPKSRGFVSINSSDPHEAPVVDPKYLSHPQDVADLVAGLKFCLQLADTEEVKKAGIEVFKTKMPCCEDFDDDINKYLECYASKLAFSFWAPSCTVKMGSETDPTTVVDPKFRVKGIKNLRVIDASTMPKIVSGKIMIPTMMMAEKGSDIIKKTIRCC